MKNIVLIGLSGCGKSTLGKRLAEKIGLVFYDMDEEIERIEKTTILEIFAQKGEGYFRNLECQVAKEAANLDGAVISTGGGIVLNPENIVALQQTGRIIFIDRPPELIAKDIDMQNRPMLKGKAERIFDLYRERISLYKKYSFAQLANDKSEEEIFMQLSSLADSLLRGSKKYAVIGHPVSHSRSPFIHNTVFTNLKVNCDYGIIDVLPEELGEWIIKARKEGIGGFNVTMPHKVAIMQFLDEIDKEAKLHNSVNTVVNRSGRLVGYSTDAEGLALALNYAGMRFKGANVCILGAGGVANTVVLRAAFDGAKTITVLARTVNKAKEICKKIQGFNLQTEVCFDEMTSSNMKNYAKSADIVINATPLGMTGCSFDFTEFDFLDGLKKEALVCDLIYSPLKTKLLEEAEQRGIKIQNGLSMLIYQALLSDKLYLGMDFDLQTMKKVICENLERR